MSEEEVEGWKLLSNSSKWHYFRKGISLCGKWMSMSDNLEQGNDASPDNCAACRKKRLKEEAFKGNR